MALRLGSVRLTLPMAFMDDLAVLDHAVAKMFQARIRVACYSQVGPCGP